MREHTKMTVGVLVGAFLVAFALQTLFIPYRLVSGGISGLSVILYETLRLPTGPTFLLMMLPIALWGWYQLHRKVFIYSFIGAAALNIWLFMFNAFNINSAGFEFGLPAATAVSGVLTGLGIGMIINCNSSTGGNAVIALILEKLLRFKISITVLVIDLVVTALGFIFYATFTETAASLISTLITVLTIHVVTHYFGKNRIRS